MPDICVTCGLALSSGLSDGGLSLAHQSTIFTDTCVTCGPALPSGLSDGGLSLAHESSVMPYTCVTCGLALPSGFSDGGLSLAHESSILPDTCVTCGLALPSSPSGVGVVVPVARTRTLQASLPCRMRLSVAPLRRPHIPNTSCTSPSCTVPFAERSVAISGPSHGTYSSIPNVTHAHALLYKIRQHPWLYCQSDTTAANSRLSHNNHGMSNVCRFYLSLGSLLT